ncbi:uncharacterized protein TM35_000292320 [Trypanosoma theileri]|uniref:CCHC-type domain-containing protein n=1 Tax=Trypanosoma theileri TaxID=67003 RepID=A0A1X0NQD8_9TRYP|nr:uncharacterized protein TM35_000292320 [Trypanosoma theileri]ORC86350.1 hypothetical protein TM35_000292320 [Trypanosoma theileri]
MPEVGLDRGFLHRCCVQVSSALTDETAVSAETQHTLRFVRDHAREYPGEITRALVWRIVDTDDEEVEDRLGAWCVLNAVLAECADHKQALSCTAVAEKINLFLPYLVSYRWYSTRTASLSTSTNQGKSTSALLSEYGKVVPASVLTGDDSRLADIHKEREIMSKYRGFLVTWKAVWRHDVYQHLKEVVRQTEREGNSLPSKERPYLEIPATFRDSLRRLRRKNPRPSIAYHVLLSYGWVPPTTEGAVDTNNTTTTTTTTNNNNNKNNINNNKTITTTTTTNGYNEGKFSSNNDYAKRCAVVPTSVAEIDELDPAAHPRVRQWLKKLVEEKGGCRLCDVWQHTELRCPCELPFLKTPIAESDGHHNFFRRRRFIERTSITYVEAVEKLFRYGIRLPLAVDKALDRVVSLIKEDSPYEEFLEAFDTVRGAVTGPLERHALWLHASYMLMPSRTVFDKPSDDALSPAMEKAEKHFKVHRRFREWDQLLQSVEVLDCQYRRAEMPQSVRRNIEEVRETKSFFFCLIDGSMTAEYSPPAYARVPEEVQQLRPVKDVLCGVCLEPFHTAARCTKGKEPWDLAVARVVLDEHRLLGMKYPEERHLLDKALRSIDEDDRKAKEFRKKELSLAVKLVHEGRVPYCKSCGIMGHSIRRCEETARRTLHRHHIKEVDMRLNPHLVQRKIKQLREEHDEREERFLTDAWELLGRGHTYPESFLTSINELEDAHIPLAAARYSTDAVQGFLLFIKSSDLLQHLQPLRDERFPEVCLFCDSYHHSSDLCERANDEERGFLTELRRYGLTLWHYLRSPERYDERFPTDYTKGRETVVGLARQFEQDYSPGGVARGRFLENNGLDGEGAASTSAAGTSGTMGMGIGGSGSSMVSRGCSQHSFYGASSYGMSFSQLVLRPVETREEGDTAVDMNRYPNHNHDNNSRSNSNSNGNDTHAVEFAETGDYILGGGDDTVIREVAGGHGGKRGRENDTDSQTESNHNKNSHSNSNSNRGGSNNSERGQHEEENGDGGFNENLQEGIHGDQQHHHHPLKTEDDTTEYVAQRPRVELHATEEA